MKAIYQGRDWSITKGATGLELWVADAPKWQKGMTAMHQGLDWVIGTLGTATAKIVRNGFELWVDIPDLAIA